MNGPTGIVALLDADEHYDTNPSGDPPILVRQYRQIVRTIVLSPVLPPSAQLPNLPEEAYALGQKRLLEEIWRATADVLDSSSGGTGGVVAAGQAQ